MPAGVIEQSLHHAAPFTLRCVRGGASFRLDGTLLPFESGPANLRPAFIRHSRLVNKLITKIERGGSAGKTRVAGFQGPEICRVPRSGETFWVAPV